MSFLSGFVAFAQAVDVAIQAQLESKLTCVCKGECWCHALPQFGGVPCPPDCTIVAFDGCHRCDCIPEIARRKAAVQSPADQQATSKGAQGGTERV